MSNLLFLVRIDSVSNILMFIQNAYILPPLTSTLPLIFTCTSLLTQPTSQPAIQVEFFEAFKRQNKKLREEKLIESNQTTKHEMNKQQLSPGHTINST